MSFTVRKVNAAAVTLDDLGITLSGIANSEFNLRNQDPKDIRDSANLATAIGLGTAAGGLTVLDPRDDSTTLTIAEGEEARVQANDTHWGINGGRFDALDDPGTSITDNFIVQYDSAGDTYESVSVASIISGETETIEDIVGAMGVNGTDTTFTYNDGAGTIEWSVNDVFLRNTGDTLDSGTLTIASGATLSLPTGSTLTIAGDVTAATIVTPGGGFTGDTDIINKFYVDQVASNIDWKDSVRASTTPADGDITAVSFGSGTYSAVGGPTGTGEFTGVDLSAGTGDTIDGINFTGLASTGYVVGDFLLIKDQTDAKQNGIYEITADVGTPTGSNVTLTRREDQDGSPASEVSGGNTVFVEDTTAINATSVNSSTTWSVLFDGVLTLNTDDMVWTQIAGPGAIVAGIGLSRAASVIDLDVNDLTVATITTSDSVAFHDADGGAETSGSQTRKTTIALLFSDLDVVNGITTNGLIRRSADDTYSTSAIIESATNALLGIDIVNGGATDTGDIAVGLDIQNLTLRAAVDATNDRIAVWDSSTNTNVYYTVNDVAGAASASNSFETWAGAGNTSGDASIVADSATDTATLTGGDGITIDFTAASDTIVFDLDISLLGAGTTVALADVIAVDQAADPNVKFSFTDIVEDLDIPNAITANGLVTRTAADTYASRTITASAAEDFLGINVVDGDGVSGNPTIGVDIDGTTASPAEMATTDEFLTHDKSEGTAGANRSMTGQQIADGVETILGLTSLTFTDINGQSILTHIDTSRSSKVLSIDSHPYVWANNTIDDNEWMDIGDASNADAGITMPLDGTIVMATGHTEDANSNTFEMDVYIDGVDSGSVGSLAGAGEAEFQSTTLDLDFTQGQKLRVRGDRTIGSTELGDVNVVLIVRWRDIP